MTVVTAIQTLVVGAVFGLALAAPPGPMNAVIAEETALRGWLAGFTAGLGAMSADALFFLLSVAGAVAFLQDAPTLRAAMVAVGGLVMLYFAVGAAREARETFTVASAADDRTDGDRTDGDASAEVGERDGSTDHGTDTRGFRKAFVLALTNPYQVLFWLTVGVGLLEPGTVDVLATLPGVGQALEGVLVVRTGSATLLAGLFAGIAVWIVSFPATLVGIGRRTDSFAPAVAAASALVLAAFGVTFLWRAALALA